MRKPLRVYVQQYDRVWSLNPLAWSQFLENGAAGKPYDLDNYGRRIKRAPAWEHVHHPLDWKPTDFIAEQQR